MEIRKQLEERKKKIVSTIGDNEVELNPASTSFSKFTAPYSLTIGELDAESIEKTERLIDMQRRYYIIDEIKYHKKAVAHVCMKADNAIKSAENAAKRFSKSINHEGAFADQSREAKAMFSALRKAKKTIKVASKVRKAQVEEGFGKLVPDKLRMITSKTLHSTSTAKRPIKIHIHKLGSPGARLPRGRFVCSVSMLTKLGLDGSIIEWSKGRYPYNIHGITPHFKYSGSYEEESMNISRVLHTSVPSKIRTPPTACLLIELLYIVPTPQTYSNSSKRALAAANKRDSSDPSSRRVASSLPIPDSFPSVSSAAAPTSSSTMFLSVGWCVFPLLSVGLDVIEGGYRVPMVRGSLDPTVCLFSEYQSLFERDLDHWLGNLYISVTHTPQQTALKVPRYLRDVRHGTKEEDIKRVVLMRDMLLEEERERKAKMYEGYVTVDDNESEQTGSPHKSNNSSLIFFRDENGRTPDVDDDNEAVISFLPSRTALRRSLVSHLLRLEQERDYETRDVDGMEEDYEYEECYTTRFAGVSEEADQWDAEAESSTHSSAEDNHSAEGSGEDSVRTRRSTRSTSQRSGHHLVPSIPVQGMAINSIGEESEKQKTDSSKHSIADSKSVQQGQGGCKRPNPRDPNSIPFFTLKKEMIRSIGSFPNVHITPSGTNTHRLAPLFSCMAKAKKQEEDEEYQRTHISMHNNVYSLFQPEVPALTLKELRKEKGLSQQQQTQTKQGTGIQFSDTVRVPKAAVERREAGERVSSGSFLTSGLLGDFALLFPSTGVFWSSIFLLITSLLLHNFLKGFFQYLYLKLRGVYVHQVSLAFLVTYVLMEYEGRVYDVMFEVFNVLIGALSGMVLFLALLIPLYLFTKHKLKHTHSHIRSHVPSVIWRFCASIGLWMVIDPLLVILYGMLCYWLHPNAVSDLRRITVVFEYRQGDSSAGFMFLVIIYILTFAVNMALFIWYLLRVHNSGQLHDAVLKLTDVSGTRTFIPPDDSVTLSEFVDILRESEKWRGSGGARRKCVVTEYVRRLPKDVIIDPACVKACLQNQEAMNSRPSSRVKSAKSSSREEAYIQVRQDDSGSRGDSRSGSRYGSRNDSLYSRGGSRLSDHVLLEEKERVRRPDGSGSSRSGTIKRRGGNKANMFQSVHRKKKKCRCGDGVRFEEEEKDVIVSIYTLHPVVPSHEIKYRDLMDGTRTIYRQFLKQSDGCLREIRGGGNILMLHDHASSTGSEGTSF
ncbi:Orofacial cleft 1 candidate gene 1 protein like protein [Aduncisulcus paluster]|uniref:Orofacial cleft 1 candidate gene 1 protein like protein n=1 Tax=Aduncisulcus paluster TaxID=2918883 RepID=A0ABQ5KAL6_9EUKA|nr:Orofacial cleft 1 candidate gene 1 protein like protein [Aduncisulcus paluster]